MSIASMIEATIGKEGGYSNHPSDTGGPTRWGITERVARANGYTGDMKTLPREVAVAIYEREYAIKPGFAAVAAINERIGEELFDTGVNMGVSWPPLFLQHALNALNSQGKHFPDILEDGDIGPTTLRTLKAYLAKRGAEGVDVLIKALNVQQGARYLLLATMRAANEDFLYGWLKNRVGL
jgi:lysozyme family protein